MSIVCLALISPFNSPIYLKSFPDATEPATEPATELPTSSVTPSPFSPSSPSLETSHTFIVHAAIDNVATSKIGFLGHLAPINSHRVYGYKSVDNHLLLAVVHESAVSAAATLVPPSITAQHTYDRSLHSLFVAVYRLFNIAKCNPFHDPQAQTGLETAEVGTVLRDFINGSVVATDKEGNEYKHLPKFQRGVNALVADFNNGLSDTF